MDSEYELLDALHRGEIRTLSDVVAELGMGEGEGLRVLRAALSKGFVVGSSELIRGLPDDERQVWRLTETGRRELERLTAEAQP